jgi:hypothetical protein
MSAASLVKAHKLTYQDAETVAPAVMSIAQAARIAEDARGAHRAGDAAGRLAARDGDARPPVGGLRGAGDLFGADDGRALRGRRGALRGTWRPRRSRLFDELQEEHQLGGHERMLLRCAAILHDIGPS